jgi:hypothetical protein
MKKIAAITGILSVLLFVGFSYLLWKSWDIFGFWTLMWTGLVQFFFSLFFFQLIGSRVEKAGVITYNPKEWPKLVAILISLVIGYYLYTRLDGVEPNSYDYFFGFSYLLLLTFYPLFKSLYRLIRDRNDFVKLDDRSISYKDNRDTGRYDISTIKSVSGAITLTFNDDTTHEIPLKNMNFNAKDILSLCADLEKRIPKPVSETAENNSTEEDAEA